ncbi:MAG: hypothetical protein EOO09_11065 [Chitinophagaceae bacterium]|nr:MAG: hypothetical protein EOO09_11065 [Chitinophagaceae bacterium]
MTRQIEITKDGSHTMLSAAGNVPYHSRHGALQESQHVYIHSAFDFVINANPGTPVRIFEMGFGTGLNALLTFIRATELQLPVHYTSIETAPVTGPEARLLNFCEKLGRQDLQPVFNELHDSAWETNAIINPFFTLRKIKTSIQDYNSAGMVDLVYYDAFAPSSQPELWTSEVFGKIAAFMEPNAVLITYCSKGDVKRAMKAVGLKVKKVPGPLYKRDILRVTKLPLDENGVPIQPVVRRSSSTRL